MKPCSNCGRVQADDAYSKDKYSADGLNDVCRECNAEKCRRWYRENSQRKKLATAAYREQHGRPQSETPRQRRAEIRRREEIDTTPDDWQLIRFSAGEWIFVLQEAEQLQISASDYVRNLVRDARRARRLEAAQ